MAKSGIAPSQRRPPCADGALSSSRLCHRRAAEASGRIGIFGGMKHEHISLTRLETINILYLF
jgi:hypothetical protein